MFYRTEPQGWRFWGAITDGRPPCWRTHRPTDIFRGHKRHGPFASKQEPGVGGPVSVPETRSTVVGEAKPDPKGSLDRVIMRERVTLASVAEESPTGAVSRWVLTTP